MPQDLSESLVIGISSRALFDLSTENEIFNTQGLIKYKNYQIQNEDKILEPGTGFPLVKAILALNDKIPSKRYTEVVILSKNSADTSLRIWKSIEEHKLNIIRGVFSGGAPLSPYLEAFSTDLFLSFDQNDVQEAVNSGTAAALLFHHPENLNEEVNQIRVAFDGDAVIFSDESEMIYKEKGLDAFLEHEKSNVQKPLPDGPLAKLLRMLNFVQNKYM